MRKYIVLIISLLCTTSLAFANGYLPPGVEIVSTDDNGIVVAINPGNWNSSSKELDGKTFQTITFTGAEIIGKPGEPQIPAMSLVLGVPLTGAVNLQVIESDFSEEVAAVLPVPNWKRNQDIIQYQYQPNDEIYNSSAPFPAKIASIDSPDFYRDQRVTSLHFLPLQYFPIKNKVRKYSRIVVRISFSAHPGALNVRRRFDEKNEAQYRSVIANYKQARYWRKKHDLKLAKRGTSFDGTDLYKININREGIYKITGQTLADHGIPLADINPANIKIYNNGGLELPRNVGESRPAGPQENAIFVNDGGDGQFDIGDYILFYGQGLEGWQYNPVDQQFHHYINHYNYQNVYLLSMGTATGRRMETTPSLATSGLSPEPFFMENIFIEEEINNPLASGMHWLGRIFNIANTEQIYQLNVSNLLPDQQTSFNFRFGVYGSALHTFNAYVNDHLVGTVSTLGSNAYEDLNDLKFDNIQATVSNILNEGTNQIKILYSPSKETVRSYMDWYEISYARQFKADGNSLIFNSPIRTGSAMYQITGFANDDLQVYDVTDFANVKRITDVSVVNGTVTFADNTSLSEPRRYFIFNNSAITAISTLEKISVNDIRTPREAAFIIVTHEDFYDQALELENLHENLRRTDRLSTEVVNVNDIYTEFSCGLVDPAAIRDFLKYAYDNWTNQDWASVNYVLFFGDGDYDFKNYITDTDKNWLPPYETTDNSGTNNRTTDDWFGYFSPGSRYISLAIGRLPVQTSNDAANVVEKLLRYETEPVMGNWRSIITLLADDQNAGSNSKTENFHTQQAESLSRNNIPKVFEQNKIYLINYEAESSAEFSGFKKPQANSDLLSSINSGTILLNFIGHGNTRLFTHERVFEQSADFEKIQNAGKLPLIVAATCDFGLWDSPQEQSFSEELVNAKDIGAIGVLGSTRLAYAGDNAAFNYRLFDILFKNYDNSGIVATLGDAITAAKNSGFRSINDTKYNLMGMPTMRLAVPTYKIRIDNVQPDTIMALRKMTVHGTVLKDQQPWNDYQGRVMLQVVDSEKDRVFRYQYQGHDYSISYKMPGNTVFRGFSSVLDGKFQVSLIVPKDITYGGNRGRIMAYSWNSENLDANGYKGGLSVGGTANDLVDHVGPVVKIGFKDQSFAGNEYVGSNPTLKVEISDTVSGVNIAGSIGHQIEMILDNENKFDLTDYFRYNEGSFYSGEVLYPLDDLNEGEHQLVIKAWDNANNSSTADAKFYIVTNSELSIRNLLNYPNPMSKQTQFTFELSQNARIQLDIYSVAGRLLRSFEPFPGSIGFNIFPDEPWDGTDQDGDQLANGIYLYRLRAKSDVGNKTHKSEEIGKLIIAR